MGSVTSDKQELSHTSTTLQKTNFLLSARISPWTTSAIGGNHPIYEDESSLYDRVNDPNPDPGSGPTPGESPLEFLFRKRPVPSPNERQIYEDAVRARRADNLKTLLLLAPSVTIPDQVWLLAAGRRNMLDDDYHDSDAADYARRWKAYVAFLASIRPAIDQGAIRIVSERRMSAQARFNESSFTPDRDLDHALQMSFGPLSDEALVLDPTIKYCNFLATYGSSAFYEREVHIDVHQAILREHLSTLGRSQKVLYTSAPAIFSAAIMKAAEKLSMEEITEIRLGERPLCRHGSVATRRLWRRQTRRGLMIVCERVLKI